MSEIAVAAMNETPVDPEHARILKTVQRPLVVETDDKGNEIQVQPAGQYRVIHGSIIVQRPHAEWHNADGSVKENAERVVRASAVVVERNAKGEPIRWEGDIVYLNSKEATDFMRRGIVEPVDAKPSRCGQGWKKPETTRNLNAPPGAS